MHSDDAPPSDDTGPHYDQIGKAHPLAYAGYDFPSYAGPRRTYVIATSYRSGSHLLADLLMRSRCMGVPAEYFNLPNLARPLAWRMGIVPPIAPGRYLERLLTMRTSPNGVFGLKAHGDQIRPVLGSPTVRRFLRNSSFVWLRRRDVLAQAISLEVAHQGHRWLRLRDYAPQGRTRPLTFETAAIDGRLADIAASDATWEELFAVNGVTPISIWYEDLLEDPSRTCAPVFRMMGEQPRRLTLENSRFVRQDEPEKGEWRERYLQALRL